MLFKALVFSIKGHSKLKWASRGANTSYFLSLLKACIYMALKWNSWSFLVRRLKGQVILLQFLIKRQQKLQKPRNNYIPFMVYGGVYQYNSARARHLPNSAMLLPYFANLQLARLPLAPQRLPLYICLLQSLQPPSFLLLSLVSLLNSNPQASVQRHLYKPLHYTKLSLYCLGRPQ